MKELEIMKISSPLVDGALMPFYDHGVNTNPYYSFDTSRIEDFIKEIDLNKKGKIEIGKNTKDLVEYLIGGDDFGAPPRALVIEFIYKGAPHDISIPYSNSTFIYVNN